MARYLCSPGLSRSDVISHHLPSCRNTTVSAASTPLKIRERYFHCAGKDSHSYKSTLLSEQVSGTMYSFPESSNRKGKDICPAKGSTTSNDGRPPRSTLIAHKHPTSAA